MDIFRISKIKAENEQLKAKLAEIGCAEYEETKAKIYEMESQATERLDIANEKFNSLNNLNSCF